MCSIKVSKTFVPFVTVVYLCSRKTKITDRMGFFNIFSKNKEQQKETLDKGLEKTKESFFGKLTRAVAGKSKVDDDVLDDLEEVLVTSDVGVDTTLNIIKRIEERVARDKYVSTSELNGILREEIAALLTENNSADTEGFQIPEGKKQYALNFVLQDPERTLTDADVENVMARLLAAFQNQFGAALR